MSILSSVASLLESAAAALRRADEAASKAVTTAPMRAVLNAVAPAHPGGFWRCTRSTFDDFVVGMTYHCRLQSGTSSMRIYPYSGSIWAPYWQDHDGRFCYPEKDLDFVYLGSRLPEGETLDVRTPAERLERRQASSRLRMAA